MTKRNARAAVQPDAAIPQVTGDGPSSSEAVEVANAGASDGDGVAAETAGSAEAAGAADGEPDGGGPSDQSDAPPADDAATEQQLESQRPATAFVKVLSLSDNHLGKCGEVIEVDGDHVEQLRQGGLIDPHPAALKGRT